MSYKALEMVEKLRQEGIRKRNLNRRKLNKLAYCFKNYKFNKAGTCLIYFHGLKSINKKYNIDFNIKINPDNSFELDLFLNDDLNNCFILNYLRTLIKIECKGNIGKLFKTIKIVKEFVIVLQNYDYLQIEVPFKTTLKTEGQIFFQDNKEFTLKEVLGWIKKNSSFDKVTGLNGNDYEVDLVYKIGHFEYNKFVYWYRKKI
jgi:hypothetical protein